MMKAFQQERLILEVTELISQLMEEKGVNKARLARKARQDQGIHHPTFWTVART